jgi:membrane protease YdiL (CAAX protease family)
MPLWVHRWLGGTVIQANDPRQWYLVIPAFLQILLLSVVGEEIGWRGFALPCLQARYGPLKASLILGVIWGGWHLPLWWMAGNFHADIPFVLFMLQSLALTILMTWLYNHTRGSLLMAHLFHTAFNLTAGVAPILPEYTGGSLRPLWIAVGFVCGLALLVSWKPGDMSKPERRHV